MVNHQLPLGNSRNSQNSVTGSPTARHQRLPVISRQCPSSRAAASVKTMNILFPPEGSQLHYR
ncbi:hypothetical protein AVEN_92594-1, partial [Araneus ventricosus]